MYIYLIACTSGRQQDPSAAAIVRCNSAGLDIFFARERFRMKTFGTPVMHVERIFIFSSYINTYISRDSFAASSSRSLVLNIPFARWHGRNVTQYFDSPVRQRQRRMQREPDVETPARSRFFAKPDTVKVDVRSLTHKKVLLLFESRQCTCVLCALSLSCLVKFVWLIYAAMLRATSKCSCIVYGVDLSTRVKRSESCIGTARW